MTNLVSIQNIRECAISSSPIAKEIIAKGMMILIATFPRMEKWPKEMCEVMMNLLGDLTQKQFEKGVREFCLNQKEIYPGTNLIAAIRECSRPTMEHSVWD